MLRLIMIHDGNIDGLSAQFDVVDVLSGVMAWINICISVDVRVYANVELIRLLLPVCFKLVQFNLNVHVIIWF